MSEKKSVSQSHWPEGEGERRRGESPISFLLHLDLWRMTHLGCCCRESSCKKNLTANNSVEIFTCFYSLQARSSVHFPSSSSSWPAIMGRRHPLPGSEVKEALRPTPWPPPPPPRCRPRCKNRNNNIRKKTTTMRRTMQSETRKKIIMFALF